MKRIRQHAQPLSAVATLAVAMLALTFSLAALPAQAQTITTLYNFGGVNGDPTLTFGTMAQGRDGQFYGISQAGPIGGTTNNGVVYKISSAGVVTDLHTVTTSEGQTCNGLTLGSDGNFYGTCHDGGANSIGTLFKVTPTGTLTVLHNFGSGTDGCRPLAAPIQGIDGNFYGTTTFCGVNNYGTAYKFTPAGAYTQLYSFKGPPTDTALPGGLVQGSDGNFWGMGNGWIISNGGVFKMTPAGKETLVYSFSSTEDGNPYDSLVQGSDGNYYGTTYGGGGTFEGSVFKLTPKGVETVLYKFPNQTQGAFPRLPLTQGPDGLLYGIATNCSGGGCAQAGIFDISTTGAYSNLYLYPILNGNNNELPYSPLLLSTDGKFYSATEQGGTHFSGSFYSLSTTYAPFVSLVTLRSGKLGTQVGILGQGFSSSSVVKFGGTSATTTALTGSTFILATVPTGAHTGTVTVTTGATTLTSPKTFKILPAITSFTPAAGPPGTSVHISGTELSQATRVTFGGVAATSFTVNSDSLVTATVPATGKTGKIAITTPGGVATSAATFTVN